jgi:hypothetical protein
MTPADSWKMTQQQFRRYSELQEHITMIPADGTERIAAANQEMLGKMQKEADTRRCVL